MFATFSQILPAPIWILCGGTLLTLGDLVFRAHLGEVSSRGFVFTFLCYGFGIFCMMMSFFSRNIATATVLAVVVNTLTYLAVTYWWYGDVLSMQQMLGVGFGLAAIVLLEL